MFRASSDILLKNNVISRLCEQITGSLDGIYLGPDSHKANLRVWVALKFSDPIKVLIEGQDEGAREGEKRCEERDGEAKSV